jgi:hypothetical protein
VPLYRPSIMTTQRVTTLAHRLFRALSSGNRFFGVLLCVCLIHFTAGCATKPTVQQVSTNYSLDVRDPVIRKFTEITNKVDLHATGTFKGGGALIHGVPVKVEEGTTFVLSLSIPITDPKSIQMGAATGSLKVSKPLLLAGVPVPQEIILTPGKATAEVDLLGSVGVFLVNTISAASLDTSTGKDAQSLIQDVTIDSARFDLRSSAIDLGKLHLNFAPGSTIILSKLKFDHALNYDGTFTTDLKLSPGCKYAGEKADFTFDSGTAKLILNAKKVNDVLSLKAVTAEKSIVLGKCTYKFGKIKQCAAKSETAQLEIRKFEWQKTEGQEKAALHCSLAMLLQNSSLLLKNPKESFNLTAQFAHNIPALLQVDRTPEGVVNEWWTEQSNTADSFAMNVVGGGAETSMVCGKTVLGPVSLSKSGDLEFSFKQGTSALKSARWSCGKRGFNLACSPDSTLSIPPGSSMSWLKDAGGSKTNLPLSVKVNKATLSGAGENIELSNLRGKVLLVVDNGTQLNGDLDFSIVNSELLGQQKMDIKTHSISFVPAKGGGEAILKQCSMAMTNAALAALVNAQLPQEKTFTVDKMVLERQRWRYRKFEVTKVTVRNLAVAQVKSVSSTEEHFSVTGNVMVEGTVEKGGLLSVIKKTKKWEEKPWTAKGQVVGDGVLTYKILPKSSLRDSIIDYELSLDLRPTKNVDLDWSQVSDGILSKAENGIITKFIEKFDPEAIIQKSHVKIATSTRFKTIRVRDVATAPTNDGLRVDFSTELDL